MRKTTLALMGAVAATFGSAAGASVFVSTSTLTPVGPSDGFSSPAIVCAADGARCSFSTTFNFAAPAGYNLQSASITTNYSGLDPNVPSNIDFTAASLNGTAFGSTGAGTAFVNGQVESGFILNRPLLANNTLVVSGLAGTTAGLANADFTGVLSFANTPAVPEPASWAMMLIGFGAAGASLRRRKRTVLQAA